MSEPKRYFINPIPDDGGALDELPNVICLDETPGITYYTYVRERTCRNRTDEFAAFWCSECGYFQRYAPYARYCPDCGARVIGG